MKHARPYPESPPAGPIAASELPTRRLDAIAADPPAPRLDPARIACWLIPFALVVYLGMRQGGYAEQIRGPVGALLCVLIAAGLLSLALPRASVSRLAWVGLGILAAFAAWSAIAVSWSASEGRSITEVARVLAYAAAFAAAILLGGRERLRSTAGAIAAACSAIALIALLSRLHPAWFPTDPIGEQIVGVSSRLRYPLGYWNGLASLVAIGLPLVVWAATSARSLALRGLAAAVVPAMALSIYFTYSRTGALAAAVAVLAYLALSRRRLALLGPIAVMAALSGVVVWQASRRGALADALGDSLARAQGDEMVIVVVVASLICGAVVWALAQAEGWGFVRRAPAVPRRAALIALGAAAVIGLVAFVGLGGPGYAGDKFDQFKQPASDLSTGSARLTSAAGNGRWQYWSSAVDAFETDPVKGIGPGTFQFWWNQNRTDYGVIRDAHSLFVENLAELGIVGLALIGGFVLLVLGAGVARSLRAAGERRNELAALTAAALAFTIGAGVDWLWELAVVPFAYLFIAAAILAARDDDEDRELITPPPPWIPSAGRARFREPAARIAGALVALGAAAVIFVPALAAQHLADSRNEFDAGDLPGALAQARAAAELEPGAADPRIQEAKVLLEGEDFAKAAAAARAATEREPTNWETFYLLSLAQAERSGKRGAAQQALERAQELNPMSLLVNPIPAPSP